MQWLQKGRLSWELVPRLCVQREGKRPDFLVKYGQGHMTEDSCYLTWLSGVSLLHITGLQSAPRPSPSSYLYHPLPPIHTKARILLKEANRCSHNFYLLKYKSLSTTPKEMPNSLLNGNSESICWLSSFKSSLFDRPVDLTHKMVPCSPLTIL